MATDFRPNATMPDSWHVRKPNPGVSARPRFQSTAQMAMAETASSMIVYPTNPNDGKRSMIERWDSFIH